MRQGQGPKPADLPDPESYPHGTRTRYVALKCRCDACRAANTAYYHVIKARGRGVETVDEWVSIDVTLPPGSTPGAEPRSEPPPHHTPMPTMPTPSRQRASLKPGDEIKYTNFTIGGSYEGTAIVTWDHGKSVEVRTLGGEKMRLERASDGSLRRFT